MIQKSYPHNNYKKIVNSLKFQRIAVIGSDPCPWVIPPALCATLLSMIKKEVSAI